MDQLKERSLNRCVGNMPLVMTTWMQNATCSLVFRFAPALSDMTATSYVLYLSRQQWDCGSMLGFSREASYHAVPRYTVVYIQDV